MASYGVYLPWERLKEYIPIKPNQPRDDANLFRICIKASRKFDAHCHGRHFYPTKETRSYDFGGSYVSANGGTIPLLPTVYKNNNCLELDEDLLEVTSLTTQNGAQTITSADYYLMTGNKYNRPPYDRIKLASDGTVTTFSYSGTPQQANAVAGYWGYHEHWADAWQDSQDTVENNPLSSSGTSLTVNDADGVDLYGLTPRFMVQQLLEIESEWLFVTGKNTSNNTLTVIRGVNGTTAAAHVQNTPIYIYQPMPEIVGVMEVLATYVYRRRESVGSSDDRGAAANGVLLMPSKLPQEVTDILDIYKRWTKS